MIQIQRWAMACLIGLVLTLPLAAQIPAPAVVLPSDQALARAESYVAHSDKYLHHSKLHRGMKGYGRTVMAGTKIVRFEAEIVSVMSKWGPHQDVILAKLSGLDLEKSGIIAGMSGSPVYVVDPTDGKEKMIGAVAYGWQAPKEPLCGIQPITQMLAVSGVLEGKSATSRPAASQPASAADEANGGGKAAVAGGAKPASKTYLQRVLNPAKINFIGKESGKKGSKSKAYSQMIPLKTPLMVSGLGNDSLSLASDLLEGSGVMLVQSGGAGVIDGAETKSFKLEPGSGIAIPLVSGDSDWSAVGTVTEVIGDRVLAFGHSFFSQGDIEMPMGPAYVHTIVSGVVDSFKLASTIQMDPAISDSVAVGALQRDETVGIAGRLGTKVTTIPMNVTIDWKDRSESRKFHYNIVRDPFYTPILAYMLVNEACVGWYDFPKDHTIRYEVEVDFGKLGKYTSRNVSSNNGTSDVGSDVVRPIMAVIENPWIKPPQVQSVNVRVIVEPEASTADILEFKIDGRVYRPGEMIKGSVLIDPYRQARQSLPVSFELPENLPDGSYQLSVCNSTAAIRAMEAEMPQRFDPHAVGELLEAMQAIADPQNNRLYLRLQLPDGGLALKKKELPDLPASKMQILSQNEKREVQVFSQSLVRSIEGKYVFSGLANATFEVKKNPKEAFTRDQRKSE